MQKKHQEYHFKNMLVAPFSISLSTGDLSKPRSRKVYECHGSPIVESMCMCMLCCECVACVFGVYNVCCECVICVC